MYTFKIPEAEIAIKDYLQRHPNSKVAIKALNGDCPSMMALYEQLCGPREFDGGPSDNALQIIYEAYNRKYPPAMVRLAQVEMCDEFKWWPEGLMTLIEAYQLGSQEALTELKNAWHNTGRDIDNRRKSGEELDQYEGFTLAFFYYYGIDVSKDESLALRLFESAAKHGCEEAQKILETITPKEKL